MAAPAVTKVEEWTKEERGVVKSAGIKISVDTWCKQIATEGATKRFYDIGTRP